MMHKIIFRGKRKDNGEWVQSGNIIHFNDEGIDQHYYIPKYNETCVCTHDESNNIISVDKGIFYNIIPKTVGQYTGLTDKNGTKIFEGDIIRYADIYEYEIYLESLEHPENFTNCVFDNMWTVDKVVYCIEYGYPAFDLNNHNFETNGLSELKESMQYHYEVIGNIHDNPELLGVQSDAQ